MLRRFLIPMMTCLALLMAVVAPASAQTKLLRFPDIHGDRVVFSYAGDLWLASTEGGLAARLTAHPGLELFPRFSPDGSRIAFTGQYDGDEQVYVIPRRAACRGSSRTIRRAVRWRRGGVTTTRSTTGRPTGGRSCSGRCATAPTSPTAGCSWRRPTGGSRSRCRCPSPGRGTCRPTARASSTPRCSATSGPGSGTRGLGAGALYLRPRDPRRRAGDDAPARRPGPDVGSATRSTSPRTGTARSTCTATTSPRARRRSSPTATPGTCAGRVTTAPTGSSTS